MRFENWSQRGDSNPRPAVYETASRQRLACRFRRRCEKVLNRVSPRLRILAQCLLDIPRELQGARVSRAAVDAHDDPTAEAVVVGDVAPVLVLLVDAADVDGKNRLFEQDERIRTINQPLRRTSRRD